VLPYCPLKWQGYIWNLPLISKEVIEERSRLLARIFRIERLNVFYRKFWRDCLTRLKYHNPAIPMTINRTADQSGPAILTIHFTTSSSSRPSINSTTDSQTSDAPVAVTTPGPAVERTEVINMKFKDESEILSQLMTLTQAKPVKATLEETRQIEELKELRARTLKDSATMSAVNAKRKREENILAQARGEVEATRES
jgi:large subunit ribosomal protein MRP49